MKSQFCTVWDHNLLSSSLHIACYAPWQSIEYRGQAPVRKPIPSWPIGHHSTHTPSKTMLSLKRAAHWNSANVRVCEVSWVWLRWAGCLVSNGVSVIEVGGLTGIQWCFCYRGFSFSKRHYWRWSTALFCTTLRAVNPGAHTKSTQPFQMVRQQLVATCFLLCHWSLTMSPWWNPATQHININKSIQ